MAVMDVECDHLDGGLRLRPFGSPMADTVEVEALSTVWVMDGRETRKLEAGQMYRVGRALASDLLRAGYAAEREETAVEGPDIVEPGETSREAENAAIEPAERTLAVKRVKRRITTGHRGGGL